MADPTRLQQVIENLCINAIQAMPNEGSLLIKLISNEQGIGFIIEDTGIGIDSANLGAVFEPLYTTKAHGIGLGLSIVKDIVEAHDGMIDLESKKGKGTSVTVLFPNNIRIDDNVNKNG